MKIEITTHEVTELIASHANLVSRVEVAESQLRGVQAELTLAQKADTSGGLPTEEVLAVIAKVFEAYNTKNKIQAIKMLRETLKCGLKEAKEAVEAGMIVCPNCATNGKVPSNHVCAKDSNALPHSDSPPDSESRSS